MKQLILALAALFALSVQLEAATLDVCSNKTITGISVANPTTVTTSAAHNLVTGQTLTVSGSNSTPTINGSRVVTVTGASTFTVAVNVTVSGNAGTAACTYTNFQTAITAAASGDTIVLQQNETFTGNFTAPSKGNASVITIKSNADPANLPGVGVRTTQAYAAFLPKIQASAGGSPALQFQANAQKYTVENVEFLGNPGGFNQIISVGIGDNTQYLTSQEPHDIILDRIYVHAEQVTGQKTGVGLNGNTLTVKNSYMTNIAGVGQDATCIGGTNGSGTYTITNNLLECGAYSIIFGGGDPFERTYMTVTGSATTGGAAVQTVEANHTLAELASGQLVAIELPGTNKVEFANLTSQPGSGTTGTLAWSPVVSGVPAVGARIRGGVVPKNVTITGNHLRKPLAWMTGPLTQPSGVTAVPSTASGTLASGSYFYRIQAFSTAGYQNNTVRSDASLEVSANLTATGKVTVNWTDIASETSYRVWCFTSTGATTGNFVDVAAGTTSLVDDGTVNYLPGVMSGGSRFVIKNLLEMKAAQSVTISGNVLEYSWRGADIGFAMWLKSVNQDGGCWFCQSRDITVEKNIFRHIDGWFLISAREYSGPTNPRPPSLTNVVIQNNLVYDSNATWAEGVSAPYAARIADGSVNLRVEHNTIVHQGSGLFQIYGGVVNGLTHSGFIFRNNMARREFFGILGDGTGEGKATLDVEAPGYVFTSNTVAGGSSNLYPAGNFFPTTTAWEGEFVAYSADGANADYHLKTTSAYHNAGTDAADLGANIDQVITATTGVVQGVSTSPPQITTTSLPNAIRNAVYPSTTVQATGGTLPYTWSVNAGSTLPTGLSFSSGGVLSGTPTAAAGPYTFTLKVVDNGALSATQAYTIQLAGSAAISTTTLSAAEKDVAYTATLVATGDAGPYTWTCTSCVLPPGITMSSAGVLSGTPTTLGTYNFTVQAAGGLGTTTSQPLTLVVSTETLPCNRNRAYNNSEAFLFRRRTAPGTSDCVVRGDVWMDTSTSNLTTYKATAVTPSVTWTSFTVASLSGDGSALTNLNASELKGGTIPASVFPNVFPAAITFGASVTTPLFKGDYLELTKSACATLSASGTARLCPDSSTGQLFMSVDGGAYAAIGGSSSTGGSTGSISGISTTNGNLLFDPGPNTGYMKLSLEVDHTADTYSQGFTTVKARKGYWVSLQGGFQQVMGFADANVSTDYIYALSASDDTGATWKHWFRVRQDGFIALNAAPLLSNVAPTISSGFGTSPTIASSNGSATFRVNVGTGASATSGVVGLPTATNGWNCQVYDVTAQAAHTGDRRTAVTTSSTTTVTVESQVVSTGAATAWAASDILVLSCLAY